MGLKEIIIKSSNIPLEENIQKEWLITNGLGGYASSTVVGINTRKYHGLLVSALKPPGSRFVLLEKLDEDILLNNKIYRFGSNEFKDTIYPTGYQYLKQVSINPFPHFTYKKNHITIEKTIFIFNKINGIALLYNIINKNNSAATIKIFPLVNCRNFHKVTNHQLNPIKFNQKQDSNEVFLSFDNPKVNLAIYSTNGKFIKKHNRINKIHYRKEKLRGERSEDDCFQPGFFEMIIKPKNSKKTCIVAISDENKKTISNIINEIGLTNKDIFSKLEQLAKKGNNASNIFYSTHQMIKERNWLNWLLLAGKNFLVKDNKSNHHIIAGYFWFGPWGRDTFISLPGLLLVRNRFNVAKQLLYNFSLLIKNGLIPNFRSDQQQDFAYNSVDASLWYINSILQLLKYTGDFNFVKKKLWRKILEIINSYEIGTKFGIKMDPDGLLLHGPQLTWMDAMVDEKAITPRSGKAVEIQSLWYNALKIAEFLANKFGEKKIEEKYSELSTKAKSSFNNKFWNKTRNCLFDVIYNNQTDISIRPNQIFSFALDFSILNQNRRNRVIDIVYSELLTPFGLRTLDSKDSNYRGNYIGNRSSRDRAYHNGTVWPWLLGPFITACSKLKKYEISSFNNQEKMLQSLLEKNLFEGGIGNLSEIFDGDSPHTARGCISQAWSVAEPLRAYVENIMNIQPKFSKHIFRNS
jgi:predicted glycogen debranching enzyme